MSSIKKILVDPLAGKPNPNSLWYTTRGGVEFLLDFPLVKTVCSKCDGEGSHVNPAIDDGLTYEAFAGDTDFREGYFSGRYDVRCHKCDGLRVVDEINENRLTKLQKRLFFSATEKSRPDEY